MDTNNLPIYQVVGYKNSGKTTLMTHLVDYYTKQGLQVGTLKHHGHGGEPDQAIGTDSERHLEAGAAVTAVKGMSSVHIVIKDTSAYQIDDLIQMYRALRIDILLIEGYKQLAYPKVVLMRDELDDGLLTELTEVIAVGAFQKPALIADKYVFSLLEIEVALPKLAAVFDRYYNK